MINSKIKKAKEQMLMQTKNYADKNKLRPYLLESFKSSTDFTVTGGTVATDSTNFKTGTYALQISNTTAGSYVQILKSVSWDLSQATDFELKFYVADKTNLSNFAVYFATVIGQAYCFKASFVNGWNTIRITKSQFTLSNLTWNDIITSFYIRVYSAAGGTTSVTLDSLKKDIKDNANLIFCFDDGYSSAYNIGIPYLESKGVKGNCAVYKAAIGTENYMSQSQILDLYNKGHDILNHSTSHPNNLGTYTYTNCAKELQDTKEYLYNLGITRGNNVLIYPSQYSAIAYQVAKDLGFVMARHSSGEINYGTDNLLYLQTRNIGQTSILADFTKYIDYVTATGGLLIIFVHDLMDTPTALNGSTSVFKSVVDYAVASGVNITTFSKYYDSLFK